MIRRRKLLEIAAEFPASGARFVGRVLIVSYFCQHQKYDDKRFQLLLADSLSFGLNITMNNNTQAAIWKREEIHVIAEYPIAV